MNLKREMGMSDMAARELAHSDDPYMLGLGARARLLRIWED